MKVRLTEGRVKTPNTKLQTPEKLQNSSSNSAPAPGELRLGCRDSLEAPNLREAPNLKLQGSAVASGIGIWVLGFLWCLVFGIWDFPFTALAEEPASQTKEKSRIEVCFVLDTTGSMTGLIEGAKQKIWSIANEITSAKPTPDIRMCLIGYRDRGDEYVTKAFDLTNDIDSVYGHLQAFHAAGGGDTPESVNEALQEAVSNMSWSQDRKVLKVKLESVKKEQLPKEWQALDRPALKAEIEKKQHARAELQTRIQKLNKERENYLARERKRLAETEKSDSFDDRVAQTFTGAPH